MVEPTVTKFRLNSSFFCFKVFSAVCIFLSHYRGISLFPIPPGCHDLSLSNEHALALSTMHQTNLSSPLSFCPFCSAFFHCFLDENCLVVLAQDMQVHRILLRLVWNVRKIKWPQSHFHVVHGPGPPKYLFSTTRGE